MSNNLTPTKKIHHYTIKIDYLVPTTITYKIDAENEHEALKMVDKKPAAHYHMKQNLARKIKLKATIFQASTSIVRFTKTYRHI
jgi:hypothetical protein